MSVKFELLKGQHVQVQRLAHGWVARLADPTGAHPGGYSGPTIDRAIEAFADDHPGIDRADVEVLDEGGRLLRLETDKRIVAVKGVKGAQSPRWGFNMRMTIPCKDGSQYLVRRRLIQTPWFGVYVHDIHEDDGDRDPHNHPWSFLSIVLRGAYRERVYPDPVEDRGRYVVKAHGRLSVHRMGRRAAHRIVYASPRLKTLILVGPRRASWGFFEEAFAGRGRFVDWQDYSHQ